MVAVVLCVHGLHSNSRRNPRRITNWESKGMELLQEFEVVSLKEYESVKGMVLERGLEIWGTVGWKLEDVMPLYLWNCKYLMAVLIVLGLVTDEVEQIVVQCQVWTFFVALEVAPEVAPEEVPGFFDLM
jgi:hypothetical protein